MREDIHVLRLTLYDCQKLCERLSSGVTDQRIRLDLAKQVHVTRMAVQRAARCSLALELAELLAEET